MDLAIRQCGAKELGSLEGKTYCFITGVCQEARSLNRAEVAENKPHGLTELRRWRLEFSKVEAARIGGAE